MQQKFRRAHGQTVKVVPEQTVKPVSKRVDQPTHKIEFDKYPLRPIPSNYKSNIQKTYERKFPSLPQSNSQSKMTLPHKKSNKGASYQTPLSKINKSKKKKERRNRGNVQSLHLFESNDVSPTHSPSPTTTNYDHSMSTIPSNDSYYDESKDVENLHQIKLQIGRLKRTLRSANTLTKRELINSKIDKLILEKDDEIEMFVARNLTSTDSKGKLNLNGLRYQDAKKCLHDYVCAQQRILMDGRLGHRSFTIITGRETGVLYRLARDYFDVSGIDYTLDSDGISYIIELYG